MKVLSITGDKSFKPGNSRFDMQAEIVRLESLYWGGGALWPRTKGKCFGVVSTQDPFFRGVVGWFLARHFKARFHVQLHADLSAQSFIKRMIARFVFSRADSVRVVSEKTKKQVQDLGVRAPITVLPIFVDLEAFKAVKRVPDENPLILWVGRFEDEKDPLSAMRIFKEVLCQVPTAQLVMLGSGLLEEKLRKAAEDLPVEFPGWQDPIPYLARACVVFSTSRAESFGASIVEALAAGVPVVAPDVGVAKEAGAIVVSQEALAGEIVATLIDSREGRLMLPLLSKNEWLEAWKQAL